MAEAGRVLITGANGRLGRRLIARLVETRPVRAAVRSEAARDQLVGLLPEGSDARVVDYADEAALATAAQGCTHVVHLVGILKESAWNRYEAAHEGSARTLVRAAYTAGLERIVALSLLGADAHSANACFASRGDAERILLDAATPAVVLRLPMVLGVRDPATEALRTQACSGLTPMLRAASREQPIHAGDVIEAIAAGLDAFTLDDTVLELAGPESLARRALVRRAAEVLGCRPPWVVSLPRALGQVPAWAFERLLVNPPVTPAMLGVLDHDDDVDARAAARRLGIELTPLDATLRFALASGE